MLELKNVPLSVCACHIRTRHYIFLFLFDTITFDFSVLLYLSLQMSSREEVQAAARMASSDTKCVVVSGGAVSDVDEDYVTEAEGDFVVVLFGT